MATREQGAWSISNKMEPNFDGGLIHNDFIQGTLFIKMTKAQRNNIPYLSRSLDSENTTACLVVSEGTIYKLINNPVSNTTIDTDWDSALSIATSSTQPIGQWDASNTNPILQDTDAAGINGKFYYVTGAPTLTDVTYPGLFLGQTTQVINDDWIMSVGTHFIRVRNTTVWDNLNRPQVIIDYENGTVIGHTHSINDITNLATTLAGKWDDNKLASLVLDFIDVPDASIPNVAFLRQHFHDKLNSYSRSEIDALLLATGNTTKTYTWNWNDGIDGGTYIDFVLTNGVTAANEVDGVDSCILWVGNSLQTNCYTVESTNYANDTIRLQFAKSTRTDNPEVFLSYNRASGITLSSSIMSYDASNESGVILDNTKDNVQEGLEETRTWINDFHVEKGVDPADPAEGSFVMWMSDGTGSGDDGDIMMKITAGGVTKTATLVDFSAVV